MGRVTFVGRILPSAPVAADEVQTPTMEEEVLRISAMSEKNYRKIRALKIQIQSLTEAGQTIRGDLDQLQTKVDMMQANILSMQTNILSMQANMEKMQRKINCLGAFMVVFMTAGLIKLLRK